MKIMPAPEKIQEFIKSSKLRAISEILDEADKIYRIHWAVRDAQINNKPVPAELKTPM
jgi:hypothetical protein